MKSLGGKFWEKEMVVDHPQSGHKKTRLDNGGLN
jgi:hypothetical protein